ncbi:MAG: hypothetical protein IIT53_06425 [Fibrobacter sp.]|nr:hypothetical protein [Fibrobacter sp.]
MAKTKAQTKDIIKDITTKLKKEITNSPKDVLKTLEMDIVIAKDDKKKGVTLGDLLEGVPDKKRAGLSAALADSIINNEIIQQNILTEIGKLIPGNLQLDLGSIKIVNPLVNIRIPIPRPPIPQLPRPPISPEPRIPQPKPPLPIPPVPKPPIPPIPRPPIPPEPKIPQPKVPVPIPPEPRIPQPKIPIPKTPIVQVTNIKEMELQLVEAERIRKALPKNATKAEKKAAANAVQQIKNLLKAAKRAEPKATKVKVKKTKKKAKK